MRLSDLKTGQSAVILKVLGHGGFRRRIMEMGFVRGKRVEVLQNAPLKDPIKYKVMEYEVSLRRSEAQMIEVITEEEARDMALQAESIRGTSAAEAMERAVDRSRKRINVALVGNPNSGKTSLFNIASGSHEHVGNYSGVTVGAKLGHMRYKGYEFNIYDLPGTYALSAYTPEEVYVRRQLFEHTPDVVVNVVTASNLERNLYLTTELIDINLRMVVALNMYDELQNDKAELDYRLLGELLGVPMVPTVSKTGKGIDELFDTVIALYEDNGQDTLSHHIHINHGACIEESVGRLAAGMKKDSSLANYHTRYLALKMLERDREVERLLSSRAGYAEWAGLRDREVERIEKELGEDIETAIANEKYGFIAGALKETYTPGTHEKEKTTNIIDTIVTHKVWGYPIFFFIMWVMFEATFVLGAYPMEWIEHGVGALGAWLGKIMADGPLKDLVVDGIIGGVGGYRLSAQYPYPLSVHIPHGGFRLYGPCGIHYGQDNAQDRPARQVVHSARHGLRMQRTGHYGHAYHREQKQPVDYHSDKPLHVVQRTAAGLCAVGRRLLPGPCRYGAVLPLSVGYRSGCHYGEIAAKIPFPKR